MKVQSKNNERAKSRGTLLGSQHFGGKGAHSSFGMGLGRMTSTYSLTQICTNQTTCWSVHSLGTFGVRTHHRQPRTHKTHHGLNLVEATTFTFIIFSTAFHGGHIQMAFCLGIPKWESWNSHSWDSRNFGGTYLRVKTFDYNEV